MAGLLNSYLLEFGSCLEPLRQKNHFYTLCQFKQSFSLHTVCTIFCHDSLNSHGIGESFLLKISKKHVFQHIFVTFSINYFDIPRIMRYLCGVKTKK